MSFGFPDSESPKTPRRSSCDLERIPQIDHLRQRIRHPRHQLRLMERRRAIRVLPLPNNLPLLPLGRRLHPAQGVHVRREQRHVLEQHALLARADPKRHRWRNTHVCFLRRRRCA